MHYSVSLRLNLYILSLEVRPLRLYAVYILIVPISILHWFLFLLLLALFGIGDDLIEHSVLGIKPSIVDIEQCLHILNLYF